MGVTEDEERRFADRVRQQRQVRGWSQAELARRMEEVGAKVQPTTIAKIETGVRAVRLGEASAIARVLDMSLDDLLVMERQQATVLEQFALECGVAGDEVNDIIERVYAATERLRVEPSDLAARDDIAYGDPVTEQSIRARMEALNGLGNLVDGRQLLRAAERSARTPGDGKVSDG
jgi:transcriptional regulator with XRE-family HTH domain